MAEKPRGDLVRKAERQGVRLGASRNQVMKVIGRLGRPFSASELLDAVENEASGVGRATVFRTLQLLCDHGLLEQVRLDEGHDVYVANHSNAHHHHLICTSCDVIQEVTECKVGEFARAMARNHGFQPRSHTFDIYGLCAACRDA